MRYIINTANLRLGGALQRAVSFLYELKNINQDNEYYIFCSADLNEQISLSIFPSNFHFFLNTKSPASLKHRKKIISKFNKLELEIQPHAVFSFVGPAYWKPKAVHLVGFGIPHIAYSEYQYVRQYSWKVKLEMLYKKIWTKHEADYYVAQTQDVKDRLSENLAIPKTSIYVVTNGIGQQYKRIITTPSPPEKFTKKLLLISRYRPSKNFEIITEVSALLQKETSVNYEFHLTIEPDKYHEIFAGHEKHVINHGHIFSKDCPDLYKKCDAMFLPSFLECFSASYPEAMKMELPILTSDLSFARTVCNDAALYFDNTDPQDIAKKIKLLFTDKQLYQSLIKKGRKQLSTFDDSTTQATKYISILNEISSSRQNK